MAADTFTSSIGIIQQGTGNNNNNWGVLLDAGLQVADDAIAGTLASTVTGGTLDLSGSPPPAAPSQVRYAVLFFTGALISNQTVVVPQLSKKWTVRNGTTGAFSLFMKTPTSGSIQIPQGTNKDVVCDAVNNIVFRMDNLDIGEIKDFARTTVPGGYLECDGSAISRTGFPDLYAAIGTNWGAGDGVTTFNLPNFRDTGRFRRSRTASVAVGTYQGNQNAAHGHTGQATGTTDNTSINHSHTQQGTFTSGGQSANHTHPMLAQRVNDTGFLYQIGGTDTGISSLGVNGSGNSNTGTTSNDHSHNTTISGQTTGMSNSDPHAHTFTSNSFNTSSVGGSETRPEAAVVLTCVRY